MLEMIDKELDNVLESTEKEITHISGYVTKLLEANSPGCVK